MCGCGAVWDTWYPSIPDIIVYGEHCNIQASQNGGGTLRIFFAGTHITRLALKALCALFWIRGKSS